METHVAVIGGGYAGLAAAVELAGRHVPVSVFESARQLGGRARALEHRGLTLDNGQHLLIGAYRETLRLIDLVNRDQPHKSPSPYVRLPLALTVQGYFSLKAAPMPKPLHLALGLLTAQGLGFGERLRAIRFMLSMQRRKFTLTEDTTVAILLRQHHQEGRLRRFLWEPLCIAALNTPLEIASARVFLNVLRDSLSGVRAASDMILPNVDLGQLFPDPAAAYIKRRGGRVRLADGVRAIAPVPGGFRLCTQHEQHEFSHIVCAIPPQRIPHLTADLPELADASQLAKEFDYQPIYTVYLQYAEDVRLPEPMLGLAGKISQWVFDRGQINGAPGLLAVVISAEGGHQKLNHDDLAERVHEELKSWFTNLPEPEWHKVIAEKRATFSCSANVQRPEQSTPLKNFYLAGDYVAGDYPATLEAAVKSGVKSAHLILENL